MKTKTRHNLTKLVSFSLIAFLITDAAAQRRGGPPRGGNGGGAVAPAPARNFDINELGTIRDKFAAYKKLTFLGAGYYSKKDRELRSKHIRAYLLIRNSLVEDRIQEDVGRNATAELLNIGEEAKRLTGEEAALDAKDAESIGGKIETLAKRVQAARLNKVNPDTLTPKINERQVTMEEIYLFATDSGIASKGQAATLRRHMTSLEDKEDRTKKDGNVSDREHEKLIKETIDVWKAFVRVLKP